MKEQDRIKQTWFSADLHLGHNNILKYDGRPFKSIEEHNEAIFTNLHEVVKPWDDLYLLGDICYGGKAQIEAFLMRLPGNIKFIRGNHDHRDQRKLFAKYGEYLGEQKIITVEYENGKQRIVLNHYPMRSWQDHHKGTVWHLYGHHHGDLAKSDMGNWGKSMDVGINTNNFYPYNTLQIHGLIAHIPPKDIIGDHHKVKTAI